MRGLCLSLSLMIAGITPGGLLAQDAPPEARSFQSSVLVIDFERAFLQSAFGRALNAEIEAAGAEIAAENRRIEEQLAEEEQRLTDQRAAMDPSQFRLLADAFDAKVQRLRAEQDAKAEALGTRGDDSRRDFLQAARPVIEQIMRATNAVVVLERRNVLIAADYVDITDNTIALIDAGQPEEATPTPDADSEAAPTDP